MLMLTLSDAVTAMIFDHPIWALICATVVLTVVVFIVFFGGMVGYTATDKLFRPVKLGHVRVITMCMIPSHEEVLYTGGSVGNEYAPDFEKVMVPDDWKIQIRAGGCAGFVSITKRQFDVIKIGSEVMARYKVGRISRQVFVLELLLDERERTT
jgi:hypothetical protein